MKVKNLRTLIRVFATAASVAILAAAACPDARADDSAALLKAMADYTAAQKSITATFDSDIEVLTPELQKIQFTSSGQLKMTRPDKFRVRRTGGYADVELVYDGKTVSLYGNNAKAYVQADAPGTIDELVAAMQARTGGAMPGTDLLTSNSFDQLMSDVVDSEHVGQGVVDGVECEHLAFRTGRSGFRQALSRSRANMRPPARRSRARRNTRSASRTGTPTRLPMPMRSCSSRRPIRPRSALVPRP